jgi:flagellar motor switch protein FliM
VALDVVLDQQVMRLSQVIGLQVGDRILLSTPPGAPVALRCGDVALFEAQLGRRESRLAVRIDKVRPGPPGPAEDAA